MIVQLTKTFFPDSAIFIEKKTVEKQHEFLGQKKKMLVFLRGRPGKGEYLTQTSNPKADYLPMTHLE